jgi:NAD(P)H-nitrite reductase large subunit
MNSLKHLDIPIKAAGLKIGDEVLHSMSNGNLRTVYVKDYQVVGFQMVGDIQSTGILRTLINRGQNIKKFKDQLLELTFRQGMLNWIAMAPWYT